ECRTDIPKLMEKRLILRRSRRNRKTRHREPRFDNRVRSKHRGWLAPSVEQRIGYHIHLIGFVCRLLPVSRIVVEEARFDIHRIQNPDVEGVGYQQGPQYGFDNVKEYVRGRDEYRCRKCTAGARRHRRRTGYPGSACTTGSLLREADRHAGYPVLEPADILLCAR
ncbi:MAG: RRXRR domain-containing protein, partial [Candidatus Ornithospirochaeta sp.]|nr:RRXRR domain-containing protein [Candidatus Ornithospirochaeta sp.]